MPRGGLTEETQVSEAERKFMVRAGKTISGLAGYREPGARKATDQKVREHVASELDRLSARMAELKASAVDEGEEDMVEELDKIDSRMVRTSAALRETPSFIGSEFFAQGPLADDELDAACLYDLRLLEDLDLLITDVTGLKYETIGNLTLREVEGTMAAIELKVTNRGYVFTNPGRS